jgi:hypothetical protein
MLPSDLLICSRAPHAQASNRGRQATFPFPRVLITRVQMTPPDRPSHQLQQKEGAVDAVTFRRSTVNASVFLFLRTDAFRLSSGGCRCLPSGKLRSLPSDSLPSSACSCTGSSPWARSSALREKKEDEDASTSSFSPTVRPLLCFCALPFLPPASSARTASAALRPRQHGAPPEAQRP